MTKDLHGGASHHADQGLGATLRGLIQHELPAAVAFRRDLHAHPELSFQEHRTGAVVREQLEALGLEVKAGLGGGTGVVAHLPPTDTRRASHPAVALRADMDALPILEQTSKPYASKTPGVMHACGHDGHTAMLLAAARVLRKAPHRPHPVTFVFQPAEENEGGGRIMCEEGVLLGREGAGVGPRIGKIFGLHGWPQLPLGTVATRPGPLMAAVDDFVVTIRGTQSHGAYPHLSRDPIIAAAHIITAIQTIASRNVSPVDAVVVTVGKIEAGTANNIIPEKCTLIGTVRTLRDSTQILARQRFIHLVSSTAEAFGCRAEIDYHTGYPVTANDAELTESFFAIARQAMSEPGGTFSAVVGGVDPAQMPQRVRRLDDPTMGGEDFSFYGKHVPACFFFLGLRPRGIREGTDEYPSLHQPGFDFNDDAMPLGIEMLCRCALA